MSCLLPLEQSCLVLRRHHFQNVAVRAAAVQTLSPLGIFDDPHIKGLQLEIPHIELLIHNACIEIKLVRGDGKQRSGHLPNPRLIEVLQILRGEDQGGLPLSSPVSAHCEYT